MRPSTTSRSSSRRAEAAPRDVVAVLLSDARDPARECVRRLWDPWLEPEMVALSHDADGVPWARVGERRMPLSVSHAGARTVAAAHPSLRVGVDLEPLRPLAREHARFFLSPEETSALRGWRDPPSATLAAWVVKEAVLKARGRGLCDPPSSVRIRAFASDRVELDESDVAVACWRDGNHVVALACIGTDRLPAVEVTRA